MFENLTPNIYWFNSNVLRRRPDWHILTYEPYGAWERRKQVKEKYPDIVDDVKGWNKIWNWLMPISMDEFPFASTKQGGEDAYAMSVPARENSRQGGYLRALYFFMNPNQDFGVIPVPKINNKQMA